MTARPIRRNAQTPDRNGKIFYTSTTSLSHISKFRGAVFAQIVPYSLCIQAEAKTVPPHQTAVTCDGFEVLPSAHTDISPAYSGRPPAAVRRFPAHGSRSQHSACTHIKIVYHILQKCNNVFLPIFCAKCLQGRQPPCPFVSSARGKRQAPARSERAIFC